MKPLPLFWLFLLAIPLPMNRTAAADVQDLPKPVSRTVKKVHGWTVRVDDRLLKAPIDVLGSRAFELLEAKLNDIGYVVSRDHLEKLRSITIVLDLTHGRLRAMQYHPNASWLEEHGYSKELAKCVHICDAADFARARQVNEQPWVVLHELAHAYHDLVLPKGFANPEIKAAYEKAKVSGKYDRVERWHGNGKPNTFERAYAMTNPQEFFAENSEAFFSRNDFFPYTRDELKQHDPECFAMLEKLWGVTAP